MRSSAEWAADFARRKGRPLRVLHIGNIANNAYFNAKIQRARGIEADVLCNDYFHIMGCPEWEDGEFQGDVGDANDPDWGAVRMRNGFKRPRWFAQGGLDACIRALLAYRAHPDQRRNAAWLLLRGETWLRTRRDARADRARAWIAKHCGAPNAPPLVLLGRQVWWWLFAKPLPLPKTLEARMRLFRARLRRYTLRADSNRAYLFNFKRTTKLRARATQRADAVLGETGRSLDEHDLDFTYTWWWHPYLRRLFSRYDIIQGYATAPAMPFAMDVPYFAYEHGTLRSIPWDDNPQGRLCLASYRHAESVFVTNTDCVDAALKFGVEPDRLVRLPHAVDSDSLIAFAGKRRRSHSPPRNRVVFFTPTRQHWVEGGDMSMAKGNDRVFCALALLRDRGLTCTLRAVAWGHHLEQSKQLIAELGVEHMVDWAPVMKKRELIGEFLRAHAIVDQFIIPAFGAITFETMILGRRLIAAIDHDVLGQFFGEAPPVDDIRTAEQIADAMQAVIEDPDDRAGRIPAITAWMQAHHSAERIVSLQLQAYERFLGAAPTTDPKEAIPQ